MSSPYQKAHFLLSVADVKQLPLDEGIEVAIVGRSNSGKSSVLNRITHQKNLARVSKTPGRTQMINLFELDKKRRLADLPGYGYAKVNPSIKRKWQQTLSRYFHERKSLKGLIVVMDIRHPLRDLDLQLLEYCKELKLPVHILLNKADKLSKSAALKTLKEVKASLTEQINSVTFQIFSAAKGSGNKELLSVLNQWFKFDYPQ